MPEIKYLYTLQEVLEVYDGNTYDPYDSDLDFYDSFNGDFNNAPLWSNGASKAYIEDLWKFLYSRFYNWFFLESEEKDTPTALEMESHFTQLINIMVATYDRYALILDSYSTQKSKLLDQVKASTNAKVGYNDTPQSEGSYEDETHRSSFTETDTESYTDGATPVERLNEIQNKLKDTMLEWANEFRRIFWYE